MAVYLLLFFFGIMTVVFDRFKYLKSELVVLPFIFLMILFAAVRNDVGADYQQYFHYYNEIKPFNFDSEVANRFEFGFFLIASILKYLHAGSPVFFAVISTIILINVLIISYRFKGDLAITLFIYFCLFYLHQNFNIIRHGLMISFTWLAFSYAKERKLLIFILLIAIAFTFHKIAIFFLPFYWLLKVDLKRWQAILFLAIASVFYFYDVITAILLRIIPSGDILYKLVYYKDYYYATYGNTSKYSITLGILFYLFILIWFILRKKKIDLDDDIQFIGMALFWALISFFIFNYFRIIVERICNTLFLSLCFLIPFFFKQTLKNEKILYYLLIVLTGFLFLYRNILSGGGNDFLPYEFYHF